MAAKPGPLPCSPAHPTVPFAEKSGGAAFCCANAGALGQPAHGCEEVQAFVLHHKLEDIAAGAAAEAMPDLLGRVDIEARRLLFVKRAQRPEVRARPFQGKVRADDFHHVVGVADLLQDLFGNSWRHS